MHILLVASTELEIRAFLELVENQGFSEPDLLIAGVGTPVFSHSLTKRLILNKPDFVLGAGIAGSFTSNHLPGDLVLVSEEIFADLGAGENEGFKDIFSLGLDNPERFPFENGKITGNFDAGDLNLHFPQVRGITVNHIRADSVANSYRKHLYNAEIETQEGAALHYICQMEDIPFIHLRSISNFVGERDKSKWKLKLACENLATGIIEIIEKLTKVY